MPMIRPLLTLFAVVTALLVPISPAAAAGPTWTEVYRLAGSQTALEDVDTTTPGDVWAAGTVTASDGYARPALQHTVGAVTTPQVLPIADPSMWGRFTGVAAVSDTDVWAVGLTIGKSTGTSLPLLTHWDGTAYSVLALPVAAGTTGELVAASARSTGDVWFAATLESQGAAVFHWNGSALRRVATPIRDPGCFDVTSRATALTTSAAGVWLGVNCTLNTDARQEGSVQVLTTAGWSLSAALLPSSGITGLADNGAGRIWATGNQVTAQGFGAVVLTGTTNLAVVTTTYGVNWWAVAAAGPDAYVVGQDSTTNTPRVLHVRGSRSAYETVQGDRPLFGVTVDGAGTAWAAGPAYGGSFGAMNPGLWRRTA